MSGNLKGRHFLSLRDFSGEEIRQMLDTARLLKLEHYAGRRQPLLAGKTIALVFQKPSTRTRVSFEAGVAQLGGTALYLGSNDLQLSRGESIADTARVVSRYVDGIVARVYAHADVVELAEHSRVPVVNGLSDFSHPCQILADLLTVEEKRGPMAGKKVAWVGDGNNVAHSWLFGGAKLGCHVAVAAPRGYEPSPEVVAASAEDARRAGGSVTVTTEPAEAARDADVLVTDVWVSMGQEKEREARLRTFRPYQVNASLLALARKDALVLHCLPAHRGEELTAELIDGPSSAIWDEAENRLHAQKALLTLLL
ncbi:MAG: ornithine carbamoyltransferase [Planctomycetes bacterium]|nr:ornithine carbamoyltransferase [Planctomycetota bacterium]